MKAMINPLIIDLQKQFDTIKDQFTSVNSRLSNIEQGSRTDDAAAAAHAQREREAAATQLEADAKKATEEAGRAYLKEQKESSLSSS